MSSVFYDVMISVDRRAVTANNLLGPAILLKPVLQKRERNKMLQSLSMVVFDRRFFFLSVLQLQEFSFQKIQVPQKRKRNKMLQLLCMVVFDRRRFFFLSVLQLQEFPFQKIQVL